MTTLAQRRNVLSRARNQRDYGKLVYTPCSDGQGFALARYGKPQPHLGYWLDCETAQEAANLYHRTNPYDRIHSRKINACLSKMAKLVARLKK